ncbi:MAG: tol-pal system protein YbgF [Gammaproteobacteria bacterium]|nr:tol-pal system protein YbgF [Gammaproteobacteria bacterium]
MKLVGNKALVMMLCLSAMINVAVAEDGDVIQRVDRLERIIQGQGLVSLLSRVDQLQNEIQRLNGDNESLRHELKQMQDRQRKLYLDLDQRLQQQTASSPIVPLTSETAVDQPVMVPSNSEPSSEQGEVAPSQATETSGESHSEQTGSPVAVENGEAAYQAALQTLRSGQYEQAVTALSAFPTRYPQSSFLPNAYYWQGEANYVLRHFEQAISNFQTVIDKFPASTKVADATLKLGFSQYELGQVNEAKATLNLVMKEYSNTSAARLAKVRLDRINQETR